MMDNRLPGDSSPSNKPMGDKELVLAEWHLLYRTSYANNLGVLIQLDDSRLELRATKGMRWILFSFIIVPMCVLGFMAVTLEYQSFWNQFGGIALLLVIPGIGLCFVQWLIFPTVRFNRSQNQMITGPFGFRRFRSFNDIVAVQLCSGQEKLNDEYDDKLFIIIKTCQVNLVLRDASQTRLNLASYSAKLSSADFTAQQAWGIGKQLADFLKVPLWGPTIDPPAKLIK